MELWDDTWMLELQGSHFSFVMEFGHRAYHWKAKLARYFYKVFISLLDLGLPCGKMTAHKAKAGGVEQHPNGHCTFVPSGSSHASLYSIDSNIPETVKQPLNLPGTWHRWLSL